MFQTYFQLGRALTVIGMSIFVTYTLQLNSQAQTIANNNLLGPGGSSVARDDNPPPALQLKIQIATQATAPNGASGILLRPIQSGQQQDRRNGLGRNDLGRNGIGPISRSEVQLIGAISLETNTSAHRSEFGSLFVEDLYLVAMDMVWIDESLSWLWMIPNFQKQIAQ